MPDTVVKYSDAAQQPTLLFIPYWVRATLKREGKSYSALFNKEEMERIFSKDDIQEFNNLQHNVLREASTLAFIGISSDNEVSESLKPRMSIDTSTPAIDILNEHKESEKTKNKASLNYERLIGRSLGDNQFIGFKLIDVSNNDRTYVGFTTYVIEGTIHDAIASRKKFVVDMIHALWAHGFPLSKLVQLGLFRHYTI